MTKHLVGIGEVAELLGLKPKTIYEFVSARRIPHLKIGHTVRFDPDELQAWLAARRVAAITRRSSVEINEAIAKARAVSEL